MKTLRKILISFLCVLTLSVSTISVKYVFADDSDISVVFKRPETSSEENPYDQNEEESSVEDNVSLKDDSSFATEDDTNNDSGNEVLKETEISDDSFSLEEEPIEIDVEEYINLENSQEEIEALAYETQSTDADIETLTTNIDITVPSTLEWTFNADGTNTLPDNWSITNNSAVDVMLDTVTIAGENGWSLVNEQPTVDNTKAIVLTIDNVSQSNGVYTLSTELAKNGGTHKLSYDVKRANFTNKGIVNSQKAYTATLAFSYSEIDTRTFIINNSKFKTQAIIGLSSASSIIITDNEIDSSSEYFKLEHQLSDLSKAKDESVLGYLDGTTYYITSNKKGQKVIAPSDLSYMFYGCKNLKSLNINNLDTSNVINMSNMFYNCSNLTTLDANSFNISNVTNTSNMFFGCSSLTSLDVSGFNTSNVTNMSNMFSGCKSLTSLDISKFNTSKVINMSGMFKECSKLTSLDISNFETSNVTSMSYMFSYCYSLTILDLSNFYTLKLGDVTSMFDECEKLECIYIGDGWNLTNVKRSIHMFSGCDSLPNYEYNNSDVRFAYAGEGGYLTLK